MSKAGNKACNVENQDKDHQFIDGIANGAAWKPLSGTMADYNYHRKKCLEISVHLGCQRWIPPGKLSQLWEENRKALLAFIGEVHMGVKGELRGLGFYFSRDRAMTCKGQTLPFVEQYFVQTSFHGDLYITGLNK